MMARVLVSLLPLFASGAVVWLVGASSSYRPPSRFQALLDADTLKPNYIQAQLVKAPLQRLGGVLRSVVKRQPDVDADLRVGSLTVLSLVLVLIEPLLAALVLAAYFIRGFRRKLRQKKAAKQALVSELPEVVDLLVLAVSAGMNVPMAIDVAARRGNGAIATALGKVTQSVTLGDSLPDRLVALADDLGEEVRPLMATLAGALREGTSVMASLERLSGQVRLERRRDGEERARKLPVKLLFPLVVCVLPAFGLLSVVPLLVTGLKGLSF